MDAYRGTIDYDGETIEDAREEVGRFLDGAHGPPMLAYSWLYSTGETIVAACLVARWEERPLISYVMTRAAWKKQGLGTSLLRQTLQSMAGAGHEGVRAMITEGNTPSEVIFRRTGFVRLGQAR